MKKKCAEQEECVRLLTEHGAKLVRSKKHQVWRFPDGKAWTMPSTPGDMCAWKNNLADLRIFLNVNSPERGKPGERRAKKPKTKRQRQEIATGQIAAHGPAHSLTEQLASLRITEVTAVAVDGVQIPMESVTIERPLTVTECQASPIKIEWPSAEMLFSHSLEAQAKATDGLDSKVEQEMWQEEIKLIRHPSSASDTHPDTFGRDSEPSLWTRFWRWVFA